MASELSRIQVRQNEVLLFKNGQPVLRVERGTTLSVIKLLYQADPRNKGTVIALRPDTNDPLPCVLTQDQSPLEEAKYEIITHEPPSNNSTQPAAREATSTRQSDGKSSNTARLPFSKNPVDPSQGASSAVSQVGLPFSHATPLTVSISPEGNAKSLASHRDNSSSSLLLARRSDSYFPSRASVPSVSRRKKTARKSVFPRKVSPTSSPNLSLNSKSTHGIHPQGREIITYSVRRTETVDSPGLCDSTENGSVRPSMEETGEEMELTARHSENYHGSDAVSAFSVEDSAGYANFPTLESSSTNGSSPAISDGHPAVIDIHSDSRETSGGENDSDSNFVSSENSPPQSHPTMVQSLHRNNKQSSHVDNEETRCSHSQTPIVVLQNTVQVKTEPNEVLPLTNNLSPEQNDEEGNHAHMDVSSEREGRDAISTAESFSLSEQHVMPTSSQEGHPNSRQVHPGPSLMPRVVNVVGASPDHDDQMDTSHQPHSGTHYMDLKEYSCDICQKQFDSANSVMRHKRSHTGDRPYICKICGWGFNLSGNLNQHLAIHQKVKPFKCVYCGKTFARSNVLKAHVRCHTGERPFQCQLCGSKFIIGHNLKKHMVTRHGITEDDRMFPQTDAPDDSGRSCDDEKG
ncbi:uncharacterized protein LOC144646175 isoform X2 [Oculina patagonica]